MKSTSGVLSLLIFAAITHFLVDATAGMLNPLWPRLDAHYRLLGWESASLFFLWQMTTSVSQFWFGLYGDRFHARWLLWAGPLATVVALGSIGLTQSPLVLAILLAIAGLGIAAYHPEAAAIAGGCAPEHRSRAMSIFTMCGFLGQATGPLCSGSLVDAFGLRGMTWTILAGLLGAVLLVPLGRIAIVQQLPALRQVTSIRDLVRGRASSLLLVLMIGSLRIVAAAGIPVLTGYLLQARDANATETGGVQSAFMLGIGLGGLSCASFVRPRHEHLMLWLCPLAVSLILVAIPWVGGTLLAVAVALSGLLLGVSLPVLISYGQQLMPDSQRIANSITMGVSWGVGGGFVSLILATCKYAGRFEPAFIVFAMAVAVSSILCAWLPRLGPRTVYARDAASEAVTV